MMEGGRTQVTYGDRKNRVTPVSVCPTTMYVVHAARRTFTLKVGPTKPLY